GAASAAASASPATAASRRLSEPPQQPGATRSGCVAPQVGRAARVRLDLRAVSRFSDCFLLLFGQLAVGGVAGLAVPPFAVLDRGFYRSSAGIFLGFALVFLAGKVALVVRGGTLAGSDAGGLAAWAAFTAPLATYG